MRIVFGTDGSRAAAAGMEILSGLSLAAEDAVVVTGVIEHGHTERAEAAVADAVAALAGTGAVVTTELRRGIAEEEILDAALALQADLVVIGASGHTGITRFILGSGAERVARHAACPVLLARPGAGAVHRVVVGIDPSDHPSPVVAWLRTFPFPAETEFDLVSVVATVKDWADRGMMVLPVQQLEPMAADLRAQALSHLDDCAHVLEAAGWKVRSHVANGHPANALLHAAEERSADLLVVGSHVRSDIERFLLGSASTNVLRHAACSVLIVRHTLQG